MQPPKPKTRLLICGGRKFGRAADIYNDQEALNAAVENAKVERAYLTEVLNQVAEKLDLECIIQGGAKGADTLAKEWAEANDVKTETYLANWKKHGKKAGILRNQTMLDQSKATMVIAFPGGTGTKDMVKRAKKAGLEVYEVIYEVA